MSKAPTTSNASVIRITPYCYIHVLDTNDNVTRVEIGPQTFTLKEHERLVFGPDAMVSIPPRHYAIIANPIVRSEAGEAVSDKHGQVKLRHGDQEVRLSDEFKEPFPLYPGERLVGSVAPLQVVAPNSALRLKAQRDFVDEKSVKRVAGDEWLFEGPGTYVPRVEVKVVDTVSSSIIKPNQALRLRARRQCIDRLGKERKAGEEWIVREVGAYLPEVDEEVQGTVEAHVLTEKKALHLQAKRTFTDVYGKERKAGEEWLVTFGMAETHIPDVYETVIGIVNITTLNNRQWCVVLDFCDANGRPQLGQRELRKGELSFFLRPGERLENGIQDVYLLGEEEALLLSAREEFREKKNGADVVHKPGDRWMVYGPCDFIPAIEVDVIERRRAIPLDENEGIYVRDCKTGKVRAVSGRTYMLQPHEELWEKDLPRAVDELLSRDLDPLASRSQRGAEGAKSRDKTRVVTFRAPHNSAVQIYDYKEKKSRVVFGPELVMLGPDEQFTVLSLSGDKPKRPNAIKSLALLLGPDFMTDIVVVETCDHARLSLQLSYNWHFEVNREHPEDATKIFQVPDFVGDACKAIASRVRGAVATESFDNFHRYSASIIRRAVFGIDENDKVKDRFVFPSNGLVVTNIDIQGVEPVDQRTRDSLQKSVQLAIEITTKSQEAAARHEAERIEQEARGRLERQKISDEAEAEKSRKELITLQAETAAVESTGQAKAEARAHAEAAQIEGEASVKQAELKAQAMKIESEAEIEQTKRRQHAELEHRRALDELEIAKSKDLAAIEAKKFKDTVDAIGPETIKSIAQAGPELQARLLQSLGLKGYLVTDGNSPINLFNTANGLIGGVGGNGGQMSM